MAQNSDPLSQTSASSQTPARAAALSRHENQQQPDREANANERELTAVIEEPAKIMRIGEMIKRLLDEVRSAPLDEAARARLAQIHERSLSELEEGLSEDLVDELHRVTLPFEDTSVPSEAELRIAQAQLVGWLEGLFHGLQTALVAQQMAAQAQLQQMRGGARSLPPGLLRPTPGDQSGGQAPDGRPTPGQYL